MRSRSDLDQDWIWLPEKMNMQYSEIWKWKYILCRKKGIIMYHRLIHNIQ